MPWSLLLVTLPTQPSAVRLRIWRALKALGCGALRGAGGDTACAGGATTLAVPGRGRTYGSMLVMQRGHWSPRR
jgi:hypothetical protein